MKEVYELMKKTLSRFLCALLVVAMICTMVPAVLAAGGPVTQITLNTTTADLELTGSVTLTAAVTPSDATDTSVTWSSSDKSVATVTPAGVVAAVSAGTATITAKANDGSNVAATCAVTVYAAVSSITLDVGAAKTIAVNDSFTPVATVNSGANPAVTWSCENNNAAIIFDSATGKVTGNKLGSATITAKSTANPSVTASCVVTVTNGAITGFEDQSVTVDNNTAIADAVKKLPTSINGLIGSTKVPSCTVVWDAATVTPAYVATNPGAYTVKGTATQPAGYVLANGVAATQNVTGTINVLPEAPVISTAAVTKTYSLNATTVTNLTVALTKPTSTTGVTYQWYASNTKDYTGTAISGQTGSSFTPPVNAIGTFYYYCIVTYTVNSQSISTKGPINTIVVGNQYLVEVSSSSTTVTVGTDPTLRVYVYDISSGSKELVTGKPTVTWSLYSNSSMTYALDSRIATVSGSTTLSSGTASGTLVTKSTYDSTSQSIYAKATVTINGTAYSSTGTLVTLTPASAADITFTATSDGTTFNSSNFYSAVSTASGETLYYVVFDTPYGGSLYKSATVSTTVGVNPCYYNTSYSNGYNLDTVYFANSSAYSKHYVTYTAYSTNGIVAKGTVNITDVSANIEYTVAAGSKVSFSSSDFSYFVKKAAGYVNSNISGYELSYVTFNMAGATFAGYNYSSTYASRYGALYTTSNLATEITSSYLNKPFYMSASGSQLDLDDVTFQAGTYSSKYTVIIPFTAVNNRGSSYSGYVYIYVNGGHSITILGADFNTEKIPAEVTSVYSGAAYVQFTLPASSDGKLYYNYSSIATGSNTAVSASTKYYITASSSQYALKNIYFVPAADKFDNVNVVYTAYNTAGTKLGTGTIAFTVSGRTSSNYFNDVSATNTGSWSANAVDFMYSNGLVKGMENNKFGPYDTMKRSMLVVMLYRAAGSPSVSGISNPFTDVKTSDYFYNAVLWAFRNGVVQGNSKTTFNPDGNIKRQEIAAILYRYSGSPTVRTSLSGYIDSSSISSYARDAMTWAVSSGYIQGSGSKLNPTNSATRAEVVVMLYRYLTK